MATSYTSLLGLALPVQGELTGTWGDTVNNSITSLLDTAIAGTTTLSTDADVTLTTTTGASNQARQAVLLCSGARTAQRTITAPAASKAYIVINATTGGFAVKVVGAGPTTGVTIASGTQALIAWNGSDFVKVASSVVNMASEVTGTLAVGNGGTGATTLTGLVKGNGTSAFTAAVSGTDYQAPIGTISGIAKGNGANALTAAVSGTDYQAPIGTISGIAKGNGANALTAATAGTDYVAPGTTTTFTATQNFAASGMTLKGSSTGTTTFASANASATNYTITFPASTGNVLTDAAAVTVAQGGTGATSAANARTNLGATTVGANMFTLVNPSAITFPQFNADNTVSALSASAFRTAIGAGTGGGDVVAASNNSFTGANTFYNATGQTIGTATTTNDGIVLAGRAGGTASYRVTIAPTTLTASRAVTLPDAAGTVVLDGATQTLSAKTLVAPVALASSTDTQDGVIVTGRAGGTASYRVTIAPTTLTASRSVTLPDAAGVVVLDGATQTLTAKTLTTPIVSGTPATTAGTRGYDATANVPTYYNGSAVMQVGYLNIPQNSQSAAYTLVLTDAGKHILHPSADTTARTFTIPANSSVAYPIGTAITFVNQNSAGVVTISITTDTMRLAGAGTTGSRTLAANGVATAIKLTATEWIISGTGLT